jgi:anthranilate phosphoribosyltransferase
MIGKAIAGTVDGKVLDRREAEEVMDILMRGEATDAQVASLLTALRMRGETADEIAGFAAGMRRAAVTLSPRVEPLVDTCGTGGDGLSTFNISTAAAFIAAGAGVYVAKHGNRGVSSPCGSADVMEALGVRLDLEPERVQACIEEVGIGFLFAPLFHPAMRHVMKARRELGIPTVFNLLGPLVNPAGVRRQVLGVGAAEKAPLLARALAELGTERAMVVHAEDGMDEISLCSPTKIWMVEKGEVTEDLFQPARLGLEACPPHCLKGGGAEENARIIREILEGRTGPRSDIAKLNAAAAIVVAGRARDLEEGLSRAEESVRSGSAARKLEEMVEFTRG